MYIKSITIDNVRGFEHWTLEQAILPNRPNILVAPNGFGKSSIATAFASLSRNKIEVKKDNKPETIIWILYRTYHATSILQTCDYSGTES